jgi:hypothetical protein
MPSDCRDCVGADAFVRPAEQSDAWHHGFLHSPVLVPVGFCVQSSITSEATLRDVAFPGTTISPD